MLVSSRTLRGCIMMTSDQTEITVPVELRDPRFPIGKFVAPDPLTQDDVLAAIASPSEMPGQLRNAVDGLDRTQWATPYREGGWTVRQLVHHIADSHMNAFVRVRLALTEDWPTIKPYDEKAWATLHDSAAP